MDTEFLLRLNIPPGLEEDIVDLLLANPEIRGYQSFPTRGHGRVGAMTIAEQVAGRRDRVQFEIVLDVGVLESTLASLKKAFPTPDVIYWVLPVLRSGRLSGDL
ncbi:DUF3240 family protein [Pseudomonadota bacterium]